MYFYRTTGLMFTVISMIVMFCYTEPEFSVDISKSSGIVGPVTIEILAAVLPSLKHLQYCQMHLTIGYFSV